jgi:outer membrane protein TolC
MIGVSVMNLKRNHRYGFAALAVILFMISGKLSLAAENSPPESSMPSWEAISVLDLQTAARMALDGNPSLASAQARVEQARQVVRQLRSAYWPRLDLDGSAARVDLSENSYQQQLATLRAITFNPQATYDNPDNYYTLDVVASWVVFDGFARRFNLAAAKYGAEAGGAARDETRRLLLSAVSTAFLSAQLARENMAIAEADVAFNERLLSEARLRYEVGSGALSDVLNFQVKANSGLTQRNQSERDFQVSRISLAALMGAPGADMPENVQLAPLGSIADSQLEAPQLDHLLDTARNLRPDLHQSDWAVQAAGANVKAVRAEYYPSLVLSGKLEGERSGDAGFENDDFGNTVALGLNYNLFAGGLTRARHSEAKAKLVEQQKNRESVELNISSEVRSTVTRVRNAQQQLVLQQATADLVRRNRDLVEKEYKAGVGSLVRLNEAQRDLIAAQVRLASAQVALQTAWYDLYAATGEILKRFEP